MPSDFWLMTHILLNWSDNSLLQVKSSKEKNFCLLQIKSPTLTWSYKQSLPRLASPFWFWWCCRLSRKVFPTVSNLLLTLYLKQHFFSIELTDKKNQKSIHFCIRQLPHLQIEISHFSRNFSKRVVITLSTYLENKNAELYRRNSKI